jgi:quercetin dioxygenase-like cupin family protein
MGKWGISFFHTGEAVVEKMGNFDLFDKGAIIFPEKEVDAKDLAWYEHPSFKGVYLKDLVRGSDTGGQFSCHIVRIEKGYEVGNHSHDIQWEFNEAIGGNGVFILGDKEIIFGPGYSFVTPPGIKHTLLTEGDNQDLYLLAKFIPAL